MPQTGYETLFNVFVNFSISKWLEVSERSLLLNNTFAYDKQTTTNCSSRATTAL